MSDSRSESCCALPETLVVVQAVPLCCIDVLEPAVLESIVRDCLLLSSEEALPADGLPLRCATVMSCDAAVSLMQEVGHVCF